MLWKNIIQSHMRSRFLVAATAVGIVVVGTALRTMWLRSDPPAYRPIGIIWHDEGAWAHNARNRALFGTWRTDNWNPVFVTPVFTALEYATFRVAGVGTWQARLVPAASGILAVIALMVGLRTIANARTALVGGFLLSTNYVFVMWNRAALIESTMVALMVLAWAIYAIAERRPAWGLAAGVIVALAWFTKAAAAFFVGAVVLDLCLSWYERARTRVDRAHWAPVLVLVGLAGTLLIGCVFFVLPNWREYVFYNWQMSVVRKPDYTLRALLDRVSWLPVVQGTFSRMWPVFMVGMIGLLAVASGWRQARPAERLLALWVLLGLAELGVHDSGNERRYLMFVPPVIALAALRLTSPVQSEVAVAARPTRSDTLISAGLVLFIAYLVAGSGLRLLLEQEVMAGHLSTAVRTAAAVALAGAAISLARPDLTITRLLQWQPAPVLTPVLLAVAVAWNVPDYVGYLRHRGELNYEASVALGERLSPDTVVHGKLANGLSLENRVRPVFVGNGFGNYDDRLTRDDVKYLLTYDLPRVGYESSDGSGLIQEILAHYPQRRVVATFEVDETPGPDRAVLIEKVPGADDVPGRDAHGRD
jgi:4-amino-4-deoxy-L-arabinose transferase-like glycosyltransferase